MLKEITDISLLIIGSVVMVILFGSFMWAFIVSQRKKLKHQEELQVLREGQQNQLIEAAVRSEEIERHRIAEALHDEVGAILSSAKLHFQGIKEDHLSERDTELNKKGKELLDEGITKVRGISHNLHSNILKEFGLNEAISHFVKTMTKGTIINATLSLDDNYRTINPDNDISIYRMIQELFNNIFKHAGATEINLHSVYHNNRLKIYFDYNGKGLSQQEFEKFRYNKDGLGLKNIMNRMILLKGSILFTATSDDNKIVIDLPINEVSHEKD